MRIRGLLSAVSIGIVLCSLSAKGKDEAIAVVTSFSGTVRVERDGKAIWLDAMVELYEGDKVEVGDDGSMVILFPSGKFRSLGSASTLIIEPLRSSEEGTGSSPEGGEGEGVRFEPLFAFKAAAERLEGRKGVRAIDTTGIFVLSPGNAHIVQSRPDFFWTSVPEAEEYVLSLQRMGKEVGTATVPDTALLYPPDWGELEREKSYVAKVGALKEGEVVQSKKVRFKVLSLESQEVVEKERLAIEKNAPDTVSTYLLLSELYKEYRLYGLAIDALRKLTTLAPEIPEFHRSLSEVYRSFGLTRESNEELIIYETLVKGN
jgi:hypothetical protein